MDSRAKDFNKYLAEIKILDKLTGCFARLFMFTDFDRPDHGIWFLQNCMDPDMDQDFIVNYDKLLNELAANNMIIKNDEKAKEKAKLEEDRKAAKAKKDEELAKAKAKKDEEDKKKQIAGVTTGNQPQQNPPQNATQPNPAQNATQPNPAQNATQPNPAQNATQPNPSQNSVQTTVAT